MVTVFDPDVPSSDLIDLNILPEKYRMRRLRVASVLVWLLAVAVILLLLPNYQHLTKANAQMAGLEAELAHAQEVMNAKNPAGAEAEKLRTTLDRVLARFDEIEEAYEAVAPQQVAWTGALRAIEEAIPEGVGLTSMVQTGREITLTGTASDHTKVQVLKVKLEDCGFFSSVTIQSVVALPTPTPTPTATATPTPTPTPTPPPLPTATPTVTPTPTPTPIPPWAAQISFWAGRETIDEGECTTLHWDVEYVKEVYLNGEGVPGHDMRWVCPGHTKTYALRVIKMDETVEVRRITITVTEASSASHTNVYASRLLWKEPSKGRAVPGLAVPVLASDDSRISVSLPVASPWERMLASSSFLHWQGVKMSSGSTRQEGRDGLSGVGVEFEIVMKVREEAGSQ